MLSTKLPIRAEVASLPPTLRRVALPLLIGLLLIGLAAARRPDGVFRRDLGGIIVYGLDTPGAVEVSVTAVFRAGTLLDPPAQAGVAELTARALEARIDRLGPLGLPGIRRVEVSISPFWTCFDVRLPAEQLSAGLSLLGQALLAPEPDAVDIVQGRARLLMALDAAETPLRLAKRALEARLLSGRAGQSTTAPSEIQAIPAEVVRHFHRRYYARNNLWLAFAGPLAPGPLHGAVRTVFSPWQRRSVQFPVLPPLAEIEPGISKIEVAGAERAVVAFGGRASGRWDPDRYAEAVLMEVLRDRIHPLGPAAGAALQWGDPGIWWAWSERGDLEDLSAVLDGLGEGRISDEEVARAAQALWARRARSIRSTADVVRRYALDEAMGWEGDQWRKEIAALRKVKGAQVRRLARRRLAADARVGVFGAPEASP